MGFMRIDAASFVGVSCLFCLFVFFSSSSLFFFENFCYYLENFFFRIINNKGGLPPRPQEGELISSLCQRDFPLPPLSSPSERDRWAFGC